MPWEEASALPGDMNERWAERVTLDEFKTMSPEEAFKLPDHVYNPLSTRAFQDALIEQGA